MAGTEGIIASRQLAYNYIKELASWVRHISSADRSRHRTRVPSAGSASWAQI